jgi:hypothetical protein
LSSLSFAPDLPPPTVSPIAPDDHNPPQSHTVRCVGGREGKRLFGIGGQWEKSFRHLKFLSKLRRAINHGPRSVVLFHPYLCARTLGHAFQVPLLSLSLSLSIVCAAVTAPPNPGSMLCVGTSSAGSRRTNSN